jgi:hypothetical protein
MKEIKLSVTQKLIAEMGKPHIAASAMAGLRALVKTQKTFPKR